jgi:hypothetical protein
MGSVKKFFVRVNSDAAFRAQFLKDPAGTLQNFGVTLSAAAQADLVSCVPIVMKHLPDLVNIPTEYDALITEVQTSYPAGDTNDPDMLIL